MTLVDKTARTAKWKACWNDLGTLFAESNNLTTIEVEFLAIRVFRKYMFWQNDPDKLQLLHDENQQVKLKQGR